MSAQRIQLRSIEGLPTGHRRRKRGCTRNRRQRNEGPCQQRPSKRSLVQSLSENLDSGFSTHRLALGGSVDELLTEVLPVAVTRSLLNDNLLVVVRQLVDNVLVLLVELELVEGSNALLRNSSTKEKRAGTSVNISFCFIAREKHSVLASCSLPSQAVNVLD